MAAVVGRARRLRGFVAQDPLRIAAAVPAWGWVAALVAVSAAVRFGLARQVVAPWIMVDELVYSELAKSFAETGRFLIRGEPSAGYGFVYPIVIAPAFALFDSIPHAYTAAKAINAVVMSLAAVPAYLLARRVVSPTTALVAAALALALPSLAYTGTLMTENAFYPLFLALTLALALALERPTAQRQLVVLALCVVAFLTRAQAVAFVPAVATAPLVLGALGGGTRRALRRFGLLYGVLAGAVAALLLVQLARGRSPLQLLGAYSVTGEHDYRVGEVARWLLYHVAELDLYLAVAPLAATIVLVARARRADPALQAFLAATIALTAWLTVEVAAFASLPSVARIEERNLFYVAPLFVIGLLAWVERASPRPRLLAAGAALVAGVLPAAIPYERFIGLATASDTLALTLWWRLQDNLIDLSEVRLVVLVGGLAVGALWLLVPERLTATLPAVVAAWFLAVQVTSQDAVHGFRYQSANALFGGIGAGEVDWVDRAVGRDADVAAVWTGKVDRHVIWENEFFNRSIGRVYRLREPLGGGLPETPVELDPESGLARDERGRLVRPQYILADGSFEPNGEIVAQDFRRGVAVYRAAGPLRSMIRVTGLYPNDTWSGRRVTYVRQQCRGGTVTVTLHSDPSLFTRPSRVVARVRGRVAARALVPPATRGTPLTARLRPTGDRCRVVFSVTPVRVPRTGDTRALGLHFTAFRYRAP